MERRPSAKALATAVIGAEYVLGWLPRGTHDWSKFVTPEAKTKQGVQQDKGALPPKQMRNLHVLEKSWPRRLKKAKLKWNVMAPKSSFV